MGCTCQALGKDAPCSWCDGPDRDPPKPQKAEGQ